MEEAYRKLSFSFLTGIVNNCSTDCVYIYRDMRGLHGSGLKETISRLADSKRFKNYIEIEKDFDLARLTAEETIKLGGKGYDILGTIYAYGLGVERDIEQAYSYFEKDLEMGNYYAENHAELLCQSNINELGQSVKIDGYIGSETILAFKKIQKQYPQLLSLGHDFYENNLIKACRSSEFINLIAEKANTTLNATKNTPIVSSEELKVAQQNIIKSDTQIPLITITSTSSNDRQATISGYATDNVGVAEVRVDGGVVALSANGNFEWQGFLPVGGKNIIIEAIDTAGLSSSQEIRLERNQETNSSGPAFADLNPLRGKTAKTNSNALALIIGVSDYERTSDPAIYADKDAQYFQDYAALKLGVPDTNILTLINTDADRIEIKKAVKNWLLRMSEKDKSDVYVFFAGHGLASSDGQNMFLLPYDGDPELLEDSAIQRKQLFADIQAISPRSVTVFLDSCYSGGTRDGGTLVASLRPIIIKTKEQSIPDGFTILSASQLDQTSQALSEAKHGLFSYFLMKGLEGDADINSDNKITAGELHSFVQEKVERQSGFKQTPDLQGDAERVIVQF